MLRLTGKYTLFIAILCVTLISTGCNFFGDSDSARNVETEAQSVPEPTPTNTPKPTFTPEPTATNLPTEIIEPISPISPISPIEPVENPAMSSINATAEALPGSEETVAAAIAHLSEQTGIPPEQITLVSIEAMDWSDTSLGCPQEGYMYAQVITPGYLLLLEAQGQQYKYHTDKATNVVLCQE